MKVFCEHFKNAKGTFSPMKAQNCFADSGILILTVDQMTGEIAEPNGAQTEHDRQPDVCSRVEPLSLLQEIQGLQTERGEGGVAAANAHH